MAEEILPWDIRSLQTTVESRKQIVALDQMPSMTIEQRMAVSRKYPNPDGSLANWAIVPVLPLIENKCVPSEASSSVRAYRIIPLMQYPIAFFRKAMVNIVRSSGGACADIEFVSMS